MNPLVRNISKFRFNGHSCPADLETLITRGEDLLHDLGIEISGEKSWAPWADKSYLSEADYRNPDIAANVKAIDDTFELISFVARTDDGETIGYWRGRENRPIGECPLVHYDTEGQFRLCGSRFVEALFFVLLDEEGLARLRVNCAMWQISVEFESIDDIPIPPTEMTPDAFHLQQYNKYLRA